MAAPIDSPAKCAGYCETVQCLRRVIQNKGKEMLTSGVVFIYDNARPHGAGVTERLLDGFQF